MYTCIVIFVHCSYREIATYQAAFLPLVEELRRGYRRGHPIRDSSRSEHDFRDFIMRVLLLFCIGDYPGQAKLCNMKHMGKSIPDSTQCLHNVCKYCAHIVHTMCTHCAYNVHTLCTHCAYIVHTLCIKCTHIAHSVHIHVHLYRRTRMPLLYAPVQENFGHNRRAMWLEQSLWFTSYSPLAFYGTLWYRQYEPSKKSTTANAYACCDSGSR